MVDSSHMQPLNLEWDISVKYTQYFQLSIEKNVKKPQYFNDNCLQYIGLSTMYYKVNCLYFFLLFKCSYWKLGISFVLHIVFLLVLLWGMELWEIWIISQAKARVGNKLSNWFTKQEQSNRVVTRDTKPELVDLEGR